MTALEVEFVEFKREPPIKSATDPVLIEFAAVLRNNPGRWGKWPKRLAPGSVSGVAARINFQRPYCPDPFVGGEFDARTRNGILFVRFTPGDPT